MIEYIKKSDSKDFFNLLKNSPESLPKKEAFIEEIVDRVSDDFSVVEVNNDKPWGGYIRFNNSESEDFIKTFFPEVDIKDIMLNKKEIELSPKLLVIEPQKKLSWQYHNRRAECWSFLTSGSYYRSQDDRQGDPIYVEPGSFVQIDVGERHRLVGQSDNKYTVIAEIWQHTNLNDLSSESDIVRLADDYKR